ncbi:16S rRNA (uracil(1498)-N(3))-methyltransferase [Camelimonas abortus]|uniref:Ribosomal RNA small subunit methyltransferase E n=1 Tax=Camelimonas abortus TaxID=1017184 RepID=A0ABV7LE31_9HYPH
MNATDASNARNRDRRAPRLFVAQPLVRDGRPAPALTLEPQQSHYLANVLRLQEGARVLLFNGVDGEWSASVSALRRGAVTVTPQEQTRPQSRGPDLHYLFAPLKHARLDYMAQKATEMGASRLVPVITERTEARRVNLDRMLANAIEAAEQCGLLAVPEIAAGERLPAALARLEPERVLIFCDEEAPAGNPLETLAAIPRGTPLAVLVGPEGGFTDAERRLLAGMPKAARISLGPRILRADTAAVAALAVTQAAAGDWTGAPAQR